MINNIGRGAEKESFGVEKVFGGNYAAGSNLSEVKI